MNDTIISSEELAKLRASHAELVRAAKVARADLYDHADMRFIASTIEQLDLSITNAEAIK